MNNNGKLAFDYYRINFFPGDFPDPGERASLAILEAQDRARFWVVPGIWEVISNRSACVTVRRTRPAHYRKPNGR